MHPPRVRATRRTGAAVVFALAAAAAASLLPPIDAEAQSASSPATPTTSVVTRDSSLAAVAGYVIDAIGQPVPGAEVLVLGTTLSTKSDANGSFRLDGVRAGAQVVRVRRLGFRPVTATLQVAAHQVNDFDVALEPIPHVLAGVVVQAENGDMIGQLERFARHKQIGQGYFIGPEEVERRHALSTVDLFRDLPGTRRLPSGAIVLTRGAPTERCGWTPVLFVDGVRLGERSTVNDIPPSTIAAIEFYPGDAGVPADLRVSDAACAVIAIWTKAR